MEIVYKRPVANHPEKKKKFMTDTQPGFESAVLVIGGGIAGIESAISMANSGYKVYIAEKNPSFGGNLGKLHRIYPGLENSQQVLGPRMKLMAGHPGIEMLDFSEIEDVEVLPGKFNVQLRKKSRYVDNDFHSALVRLVPIRNC